MNKPIAASLLLLLLMCSVPRFDAQIRPPTFSTVTPYGAKRGTTVTLTVEGTNLGDASELLVDDARITSTIVKNEDQGADKVMRAPGSTSAPIDDRASKNKLTIEVKIGEDARLGRHSFRIKTPLGTTNLGTFLVGAMDEQTEREPNGALAAQKLSLPVTVTGTIDSSSDVDLYSFEAKAGQQLVFEIAATTIGSSLDSTLTLMDASGKTLAASEDFNKTADSVLGYTFSRAGSYLIRVSDALGGGSRRHYYRLTAGELPYATNLFPLGVSKSGGEVAVSGFNLKGHTSVKIPAAPGRGPVTMPITTAHGQTLNTIRVARGEYNELVESEPNDDRTAAIELSLPITINGRIENVKGRSDEDLFAFKATRGQKIVLTVAAQQLGSPLDSVIEVFDAAGREIPRSVLRPVWQTVTTLNDRDSFTSGLRLDSWSALAPGDFVMVGNELLQVEDLPKSPDADVIFKSLRGRRVAFEGTTPEGHAMNSHVYKVEVHKPGSTFPPNGMPVVNLSYRNDDGGPGYGKDSYLVFTAPSDGKYFVRIRDVLGHGGDSYAYRMTIAEPAPRFTVSVSPANPNVPRGGRVPITVTATRIDGFDGEIEVELKDLPEGIQATRGVILPGHNSVSLTISASETASTDRPRPFKVSGSAVIGNKTVTETDSGSPINVVSAATPPDVYVTAVAPAEIEIEPGGRARISVRIKRSNGFEGRIPISVQNLPFDLSVPDIGLNGILINEKEETREFWIVAGPKATPSEQTIYLTARVETNSPLASEHASTPIKLKILNKQTAGTR